MITTIPIRLIAAAAALLALGACSSLSEREGQLVGAGTGALVGASVSDGVIAPVIGAVGGAIIGEELAEPDPLAD